MTGRRRPLRIGLVGAGMVSRHHLEAWSGIEDAEVVAIADPDLARAQSRACVYGIEAVYPDARAMLAEAACDAVDIAAPVAQHGPLCRLAADQGIAILCQKPLADSFAEAEGVVRDVNARVRFMVHENWRFRASYRQVKCWLEERQIGEVTGAKLSVTSSGLLQDADGTFPALARQPFLARLPRLLIFEVLIHHLDVLGWLFGELKIERTDLSRQCEAVRGEDTARVCFRTSGEKGVELTGSLVCPGAPRHICDHLTITGTEGTIDLSDTHLALDGRVIEQLDWSLEALYGSAFEGALRHFVERLTDGQAFETEAADNLAVLRLVEKIYGWS